MEDDERGILDVKEAILTGNISERQKDKATGEWKYVIRGHSLDRISVSVVGKISFTGKLIITPVFTG